MAAKPQAYARAIFEAAVEENLEALRRISAELRRNGLASRLDDPAMAFEAKKERLDGLLPEDADPQVRNLLYTLASNNDLSLLDEILDDYERLLAAGAVEISTATVTSAVELSPERREEIESAVRARFGQEIQVRFVLDEEILGGLVIRVGDQVLDGSVRGRLESLREQLKRAG